MSSPYVSAHCEIPCGIYDDKMRVAMISEHIDTIEKSIKQIMTLENQQDKNYNQMTRWVVNKENHATEIQHIVSQYFLTQRIKFDSKNYIKKITLLHKMLVYAMKCKQTTDLSNINQMRSILKEFNKIYLGHNS
jgi:nickel superoxide dismutase